MRPTMTYSRLLPLMLVVPVLLAVGAPTPVRASGSYVYYSEDYNTPQDSDEQFGDNWYWYRYCEAEADDGSTYSWSDAAACAQVSWGEGSYYQNASVSTCSYADSTVGYEWQADPNDPNEIPPGGTFGYSLSAGGSAGAYGSSWLNGSEYHFSGECSSSGYSGGGGSASPGGGEGGYGSAAGNAQNNDYSSISWDYDPEGYVAETAGDGYYDVGVHWSLDDGDSGISVEEGTTSVSGYTASGTSGGASASGYWNGQTQGSAGGGGTGWGEASASITISFSSN